MKFSTARTGAVRSAGLILTLGLCLLALACGGARTPTPPVTIPTPTPRPNLLWNAGFLDDASAWQVQSQNPVAALTLNRDQAGFVTVSLGQAVRPESAGWTQTLAVEPEAAYYVSYRVRTDKLAGLADLRLAFYDRAGRRLWETGVAAAAGDTPWTTWERRLRAPPGAVRATVWLGVAGATAGQAALGEPLISPDDAPLGRALIVDYVQEAGTLRSLHQANLTAATRLLAPDGVGTRGLAALDLRALFPYAVGDPEDPASYRFQAADALLAAVAETGAGIFFRLGGGHEGMSASRWAQVAAGVATHYNSDEPTPIRYWEVEQEPGQPAERYCERLAATMRALKAQGSGLRVGGPGLAMPACLPQLEAILAGLVERDVRADFVSWRSEDGGNPWALAALEVRLERLLDRYGLGDVELINSGWGPVGAETAWAAACDAAHLAASASYWQDTRLAQAYRDAHADLSGGELTATGHAFRLLGELRQTPRRLVAQGGDSLGFTVLAGKSDDGRTVHILIADTGSRSQEYRLALAGFPRGYRYTVTEVSPECQGEVVAQGSSEGLSDGVLTLPWRAPAVHLIRVWWGGGE